MELTRTGEDFVEARERAVDDAITLLRSVEASAVTPELIGFAHYKQKQTIKQLLRDNTLRQLRHTLTNLTEVTTGRFVTTEADEASVVVELTCEALASVLARIHSTHTKVGLAAISRVALITDAEVFGQIDPSASVEAVVEEGVTSGFILPLRTVADRVASVADRNTQVSRGCAEKEVRPTNYKTNNINNT